MLCVLVRTYVLAKMHMCLYTCTTYYMYCIHVRQYICEDAVCASTLTGRTNRTKARGEAAMARYQRHPRRSTTASARRDPNTLPSPQYTCTVMVEWHNSVKA